MHIRDIDGDKSTSTTDKETLIHEKSNCSGQVEAAHSFLHCDAKFLAHNILRTVFRKLEVVHAGHNAR